MYWENQLSNFQNSTRIADIVVCRLCDDGLTFFAVEPMSEEFY